MRPPTGTEQDGRTGKAISPREDAAEPVASPHASRGPASSPAPDRRVHSGAEPPDVSDERRLDAALERYRILRPAVEDGVPLARAAEEAGVPLRTAQRWMAAYKRGGLAGLTKGPRSDRGHCHGLPPELEEAIKGLALATPKPSMPFSLGSDPRRRRSARARRSRASWPRSSARTTYSWQTRDGGPRGGTTLRTESAWTTNAGGS